MPAERAGAGAARDWARIGVGLALGWFAVRLVAFAVCIDPGVPPDETTHLGRILAYAGTALWPAPGPENHALGLLGDRPFLYSWTLARAANLGLDSLLALRLLNAALAFATALYGVRFIRVVSAEPGTWLVFTILLTNTLMFTGIGAAISYDNGVNLLAAVAFFHAARLARDGRASDLAWGVLALGLGCLTKRSFLPLAAILVVAVAIAQRHRLGAWLRDATRLALPLQLAVAVVLLANAALYGSNLVRFGRLVPGFEQVVGVEAARQNRIFARDWILDGYREGRLSFQEAASEAARIEHAADRSSTLGLLRATRKRMQVDAGWRLDLASYTVYWGRIVFERSIGYFGHRVLMRSDWERVAFGAVVALAIAFQVAARWRSRPSGGAGLFAGIAVAYALVLLLLVNRPTYVEKGILDAGVQGRYLFPVWIPLMAFLAVGLWESAPRPVRLAVSATACALFLWSDAPSLWLRAGPEWFAH